MNGLEELVSILQQTLSPDQAGLDFAAHWLETHTGPHLVGGLLAVLLEDQLESGVRRQAGLQLRRLLTNQQVWHQLGNLRAEVRRGLVEALAKENWRPSVVALCVKQVASLESWPGIVPALVARLASNQEMEVLATLDTLAGLLDPGSRARSKPARTASRIASKASSALLAAAQAARKRDRGGQRGRGGAVRLH